MAKRGRKRVYVRLRLADLVELVESLHAAGEHENAGRLKALCDEAGRPLCSSCPVLPGQLDLRYEGAIGNEPDN